MNWSFLLTIIFGVFTIVLVKFAQTNSPLYLIFAALTGTLIFYFGIKMTKEWDSRIKAGVQEK